MQLSPPDFWSNSVDPTLHFSPPLLVSFSPLSKVNSFSENKKKNLQDLAPPQH
uniref:Uncharacterized protein n=1 Tax=Arundo donax TaxID=35708 RepID=A0A0A9GNK9_ARUDO